MYDVHELMSNVSDTVDQYSLFNMVCELSNTFYVMINSYIIFNSGTLLATISFSDQKLYHQPLTPCVMYTICALLWPQYDKYSLLHACQELQYTTNDTTHSACI